MQCLDIPRLRKEDCGSATRVLGITIMNNNHNLNHQRKRAQILKVHAKDKNNGILGIIWLNWLLRKLLIIFFDVGAVKNFIKKLIKQFYMFLERDASCMHMESITLTLIGSESKPITKCEYYCTVGSKFSKIHLFLLFQMLLKVHL
ncbi:hypothetical protein ACJX0J_006558, partial [Zea mays]